MCTDTYGTRNKICSKKPFRDNQGHLENPYDLEPLRSRPSLKVSDVASQCNARYDETEPLRPAPYPKSFEPTPSSHIKPGLRRQKCRCCPSRCSSPDCHSSTVGRPPGFAQKTATSNQGGSQHLTLSRIFNRSYRSPKQRQQLHPSHLGKITKTPRYNVKHII